MEAKNLYIDSRRETLFRLFSIKKKNNLINNGVTNIKYTNYFFRVFEIHTYQKKCVCYL